MYYQLKEKNAKTADATLVKFMEYSGYLAISFIQSISLTLQVFDLLYIYSRRLVGKALH